MPHTLEAIAVAVDRHLVHKEPMAAIARSSTISLTQLKHYVKMKRETGTISIKKAGAKPALPATIETDIAAWAAAMQRSRWPVDRLDLIAKANQILAKSPTPRTVGRDWCAGFLRRHPDLASRRAQALSRPRNGVTMDGIRTYFYNLLAATLGFKCTAANIYNMDETSFKTKGTSRTVIAVKGSTELWSTEPNQSYHMTIVAAVAADGVAAPPAFILPSMSVETTVLDDCPVDGALVSTAPKGFINSDLFNQWLIRFGEWKLTARGAAPAILIIDNCASHLDSPETAAIEQAYGVKIIRLPPNSTHLLQPLDVAVFRTFKASISRKMTEGLRASSATELARRVAIQIAGSAYNDMLRPKVQRPGDPPKQSPVVNGFVTCGAWPLSLVAMERRLRKQMSNGVRGTLGTEAWIKVQAVARDTVLVVPAKPVPSRERKRVATDSAWMDRVELHAAAARSTKTKRRSD